ncbi:flagellar biosynthetic protein FliO [Uliginosibacterium sp. H3]|uniref:Flagellar protein n=1 Tax=Uliginosibacterium silvisoli TaxID=3114758 RepID=A0ABU6K671_9RHOO|nr:flagellar biosynthetic protein FliO [Uliginosibacterium sp. H3]
MKPIVTALFTALFFLPGNAAHAAEGMPSMASSVAQMIFGLVIVLAALFGVLAMLRKLQGGRTHLVGGLKVIGATSVGPRERVVLVTVGSKVLVLGVTPGRVNALHTLEASELPLAPEPSPAAPNDFAARLRQMLEKRHAG